MKKLLLVFVAVWLTFSGFAQRTSDIGIWGGASTYFGDMDEVAPFQTFNPNFGAYFRYNFNARVAMRAMFLTGSIAEGGVIESVPWAFNKNVHDFTVQIEINYLKYILGVKNTPYSAYVMAGLGVVYYPYELNPAMIATFNPQHNKGNVLVKESVIGSTIPFGFGFKYSIGTRLGVGIEYQMRKMFDDKLDDLDDPLAFIDDEGKETLYTSGIHNNDWSGYLGIHITYKIYMGKKVCPAYESKN